MPERILYALIVVLLATFVTVPAARAQSGVLLNTAQAFHEIFPEATGVATREYEPNAAERGQLEARLGRRLEAGAFRVLLAYGAGGALLGYAVVTDERGKYRPITFMVGITPDIRVKDTAIMVYREDRGGEVQKKRFLGQYRGKRLRDPMQVDRDIINITGATISVRSVNNGVRKVLVVIEQMCGAHPPLVAVSEIRPLTTLQ